MVKWWIFTWRFIGLDAADQGFDLIMMTHPADLDTFPTPHMLNYWPREVVVDIQYSTNHGLENIKQALRDLACSVGIEHRDWFNMGSTWYGDGRKVRNLARLTVALNKYGRAQMFGPGTTCTQ